MRQGTVDYSVTGPHIHSHDSVSRTMLLIVVSLMPVVMASLWLFGAAAVYPVFGTAFFCVLFEVPFTRGRISLRQPFGDGSALVAGLILGLSLSPVSPWWIPPLGALILVTLGKQMFGGIGNNIFNPALVARAVLLLSWPRPLTQWSAPFDGLTGATPLGGLETGYWELLAGMVPGSLGETSAIAIVLGALFLACKGLIQWQVPVAVIIGAVTAALCFGLDPLFTVLSGSLLFGAVFMATDMVTSPTGKTASRVFGFGCGFLTVFIRRFTYYPEGVTFAFLIMNGLAYLFDRIGADPIFGQVHERNKRLWAVASHLAAVLVLVAAAGVSFGGGAVAGKHRADATQTRAVRRHFPRADRIVEMTSYDAQVRRYRIYRGRDLLGFFAEVRGDGYGGEMEVKVALGPDRDVRAVHIGAHRESPTLGTLVTAPAFLGRFAGFHQGNRTLIRDRVEAISGATVSSRAVMRAVERALAAGDPATARSATATGTPLPTVDDGVYAGTGQGYQGPIAVHVTVQGGRVTDIAIRGHNETAGIGTRAMDALIARVVQSQSAGIDAVSGATGTSQGFLTAVEHALDERGNGE